MKFLNENQALVMVILFAAVIALIVTVLVVCNKIYKNFYVKKFSFTNLFERASGVEYVTLIVSNKSLNDMTVTALGFCSGLTFFDYIGEYRKAAGILGEGKVIIPARSSVTLRLPKETTENSVLFDMTAAPKALSAYVVDSYGGLCKGRVKVLHKQFAADYKAALLKEKQAQKQAKIAAKRRYNEEKAEDLTIKRLRGDKLSLFESLFLKNHAKALAKEAAAARVSELSEDAAAVPEESILPAAEDEALDEAAATAESGATQTTFDDLTPALTETDAEPGEENASGGFGKHPSRKEKRRGNFRKNGEDSADEDENPAE